MDEKGSAGHGGTDRKELTVMSNGVCSVVRARPAQPARESIAQMEQILADIPVPLQDMSIRNADERMELLLDRVRALRSKLAQLSEFQAKWVTVMGAMRKALYVCGELNSEDCASCDHY